MGKSCVHQLLGPEMRLTTITGNMRWHLDCFKCFHCYELLDEENVNLLLLGHGVLACQKCLARCASCENKIEEVDVAIIAGSDVYCADCFRCANCKKNIESLPHARTKHGLFCVSCHLLFMPWTRALMTGNPTQSYDRKKEIEEANAKLREEESEAKVAEGPGWIPNGQTLRIQHGLLS